MAAVIKYKGEYFTGHGFLMWNKDINTAKVYSTIGYASSAKKVRGLPTHSRIKEVTITEI